MPPVRSSVIPSDRFHPGRLIALAPNRPH
jgi:hypothetical protein